MSRAMDVYRASDANATKALYVDLQQRGELGVIAVNLFRAQKASERAKKYRGGIRGAGSYRGMAYEKKNWSMQTLCTFLVQHGEALGLRFGWYKDPYTPGYEWVLYVDLPTGQVSFHSAQRFDGPDYAGVWDGERGMSALRIVQFCDGVLALPRQGPAYSSVQPPARAVKPPRVGQGCCSKCGKASCNCAVRTVFFS